MQCPKCQTEIFEMDDPCPQCDPAVDADRPNGLDQHQLEEQASLESRRPSFTPEEAEKAWVELAQLETLFEKVDEWRKARYFKAEMETRDPVRKQRAHADELRQRLEEYQRPELPQTDQDRLKTVDFLLDSVDLLASRHWFKSKKEIEKVVVPIMAMMLDVISDSVSETESDT
jgi:hypothetical protein